MGRDLVPIVQIAREEVPLQQVVIDCIGLIEPKSSDGHRYCARASGGCAR